LKKNPKKTMLRGQKNGRGDRIEVDFPGLLKEKLPSGNFRYRVRVEGNPRKRVRLYVEPDHKDFHEHYLAARQGIKIKPDASPADNTIRGSVAWLTFKHFDDLEVRVSAGLASPLTLKKRRLLFRKLRNECGEYSMEIPSSEIIKIRDSMAETPAWADSMTEAIRTMYRWANERGMCDNNPAIGIGKIDKGRGGAKPWTVDDLKKYRETHQPGTTAHLCLTLFMFTACRISDVIVLGRGNEFERDGVRGLGWQPRKSGSAFVEIPILPPLYKATRVATVQGPAYLLTEYGKAFKSPDALGQRLKKWCRAAGLNNRSSHGIRKAAGHLLAQEGCSQYQIMSIHGHTQAKTSEVYTKGVERWKMAVDAMQTLEAMEW
jgi:integrase